MQEQEKSVLILFNSLEDAVSKTDKNAIEEISKKLVEIEIYPASTPYMERAKKSLSDMVLEFGTNWHKYPAPTMCPSCCEDLRSKDGTPFKNEIAIVNYNLGIIVDFVCPTCKHSILTGKEYKDEDLEHTEYFN